MVAGRQRTFDKQDALNKAMKVFWLKGYSGAALSDLTDAMGINKPSLYAAFGNKEALFVSALKSYAENYGRLHFEKLMDSQASLKERLQAYLMSIARMVTDPKLPGGCFVASSTSESSSHCLPDEAIRTILNINADSSQAFIKFFENEKKLGNIKTSASAEVLANYLLTVQFGLSIMARNGTGIDNFKKIIAHSLLCFDTQGRGSPK